METFQVSKDKDAVDITSNLITGNSRISCRKLTKYEFSTLIGSRAEAINNGSRCLLPEIGEDILIDPMAMAKKEFDDGYLSYDIHRPVYEFGQVKYEVISIRGKDLDVHYIKIV